MDVWRRGESVVAGDVESKNAAKREAVGRLFTVIKDAPIPQIPPAIERACGDGGTLSN